MAEHTPGPWAIFYQTFRNGYYHWKIEGDHVRNVGGFQSCQSAETAKADAHLIAVAPELLAALEWALSELDVWEPEETHPDSEYQAKKAAARAVSTNARGETSHG